MTLLNAGRHGLTDGGGEIGSKRPSLGVLRQDGSGPFKSSFEYCVLSFVGGKPKISNSTFYGISYP